MEQLLLAELDINSEEETLKHKGGGLMKKITTLIMLLSFSSFLLVGTAIATPITPGSNPPLEGAGGILDQIYGQGNLQRVDDAGDQTWFPVNGSVTAIAKFSDRNQTLGFIPDLNSDGFLNDPFLPLFTVPGGTNGIGLGGPTATFNLGLAPGGDPTWTSKESQNSDGNDHMVTWRVLNNPNTWVVAWEETNGYGGDFSDLVAEIIVSPGLDTNNVGFLLAVRSNPVPEPCTMLLFGAGLAGIVGARFRRKKK